MNHLYDLLHQKGIEFYQTDRLSLSNYYYEPFQDSKEIFDEKTIFETDPFESKKKLRPYEKNSLFKYFLDGSRKPYKIGDIITTDNKFVPVVTGQIGTACCYRNEEGIIKLFDLKRKNVLMLYDSIQEGDFLNIKDSFEESAYKSIILEKYSFDKIKDDLPTNAAVAKIQKIMQDMEINLLEDMVEKRILKTDEMLIIDGSLQFMTQKYNPEIFYNVIGISKHFNPNLDGVLKGKKQIGVLLSKLDFGERTPVYEYKTEGRIKNKIGAWYLRIREKKFLRSPLDGIIKIEKMAMQDDIERNGFETSIVDNISMSILAERNPTCHGKDMRWANHLYPIYLTEKILKSSFMSDLHFMNLI